MNVNSKNFVNPCLYVRNGCPFCFSLEIFLHNKKIDIPTEITLEGQAPRLLVNNQIFYESRDLMNIIADAFNVESNSYHNQGNKSFSAYDSLLTGRRKIKLNSQDNCFDVDFWLKSNNLELKEKDLDFDSYFGPFLFSILGKDHFYTKYFLNKYNILSNYYLKLHE